MRFASLCVLFSACQRVLFSACQRVLFSACQRRGLPARGSRLGDLEVAGVFLRGSGVHLSQTVSAYGTSVVVSCAAMQVAFIDMVLLPMHKSLSALLPKATATLIKGITTNRARWLALDGCGTPHAVICSSSGAPPLHICGGQAIDALFAECALCPSPPLSTKRTAATNSTTNYRSHQLNAPRPPTTAATS